MMSGMVLNRKHSLVQGKPIRFRFFQVLCWTGIAGLLGVGFIAGLYWWVLQQKYPFAGGASLKNWWDGTGAWAHKGGMGFIRSAKWPAYRHGIRDNGEPETWALVGGVLLGSATVSQLRIPLKLVPVAAMVLLCCILSAALGLTWLTDFGPLSKVSDIFSWQQLILGFLAGQVLHRLWKPVGATIRYHMVSRSLRNGTVPLWVALPLRPPPWRELWQELKDSGTVKAETAAQAQKHRGMRFAVSLGIFLFVVIAITGLLAKFIIAHGGHVPGMTS